SNQNVIQSNRIGVDATGKVVAGNFKGLLVSGAGNLIQSNTISGNGEGILFFGANGNSVVGNFIGTDTAGGSALGNRQEGIRLLSSSGNLIQSNVISGNVEAGILVENVSSAGNVILGNYIGTNGLGTVARPNGTNGVEIINGAHNNTVQCNLISGNTGNGV